MDPKSRRVLSDHKRLGKRFIPPLLQLGDFAESKWADRIIPELLWIALLHDEFGLKTGADLALALAKTASDASDRSPKPWFGSVTSFSTLSEAQHSSVITTLEAERRIEPFLAAFRPLVAFYPECPLSFLFHHSDILPEIGRDLPRLKRVVAALFDRGNKPATMTQATAVYIAFVTEKLKATEGLALANFPEIENFPDTEESQRVACSVRCAVTSFFAPPTYSMSSSWPEYFWNTGLHLEPCCFREHHNE